MPSDVGPRLGKVRQRDYLPAVVERLAKGFAPLKIVLFGSVARGEEGPWSDLDLLVVMPEGTDKRKTAAAMHRALVGGLPVAADIFVVHPADLEKYRDYVGHVVRPALREGEVVYDA
ncbi:MAG: nucleotidyltransferase domain-containing protein [Candidatus Sericytochromatia bacterium]|nr:nucleotidyltransferase domain-containing protein [Candidatus Tanganyikabacteria bacterium]